MRNSVQMVGQAHYSHSYLQGKSCEEIKELLRNDYGLNWETMPTRWRHGVVWSKSRGVDYEAPLLRGEDREYLEHEVYFVEEQ